MGERTERGVDFLRCAKCRGLWLEPGGIEALFPEPSLPSPTHEDVREQMRAVAPPPRGVVRYFRCPRCDEQMSRALYGRWSGVVVDRCPPHGVFLDSGELAAIETFIRIGGLALERQSRVESGSRPTNSRTASNRSDTTSSLARWDPTSEKLLRRHLEPGEELVWVGHPAAGEAAGGGGADWAGFALGLAFVGTVIASVPWTVVPWLVGLVVLTAPLWILLVLPRVVIYAVTTRRVMILDTSVSRRPRSLSPADLGHVSAVPQEDGSGDVVLTSTTTLRRVPNVAKVERIVRALAAPLDGPTKDALGDGPRSW